MKKWLLHIYRSTVSARFALRMHVIAPFLPACSSVDLRRFHTADFWRTFMDHVVTLERYTYIHVAPLLHQPRQLLASMFAMLWTSEVRVNTAAICLSIIQWRWRDLSPLTSSAWVVDAAKLKDHLQSYADGDALSEETVAYIKKMPRMICEVVRSVINQKQIDTTSFRSFSALSKTSCLQSGCICVIECE